MTSYTFDQLLDFTRTTSGTFVGSNGLIQTTPASVNLLTFTQAFDNAAWIKYEGTVTANAAIAPDNTSTADVFTENTTASTDRRLTYVGASVTVGQAHTLSVYAKANGRNFISVFSVTENRGKYFSIPSDGSGVVLGDFGLAPTSAAISYVGNGWYRCSITFTTTAASQNVRYYPCDTGSTFIYTGNGTSGIFVWGAQLQTGSTATTYTRNNGGRFPARFDYDPATLAPKGILIEEQRTNLALRSEEFDNAAWTKNNATVTANSIISPSGALNADTLTRGSFASEAMARQATSQAVSTTHTLSVFAKAGSAGALLYLRNVADNVVGTPLVTFALDGSNTMTPNVNFVGSSTITPFGNGWYRCTITSTTAAVISGNLIDIGCSTNAGNLTGTAGAFIYVYGSQLEAGASATSYIPTVASQVTRATDVCSIVAPNFAPWYNQSEGTFVAEFDTTALLLGGSSSFYAMSANASGTANHIGLYVFSNFAGGQVRSGGVTQADLNGGGSPTNGATIKSGIAYAANNVAVTVNGATPATDTSVSLPTVNTLSIGNVNLANQINGHIRSVQYYPVRLADFQLQALTA